jgi:hypothetical protein
MNDDDDAAWTRLVVVDLLFRTDNVAVRLRHMIHAASADELVSEIGTRVALHANRYGAFIGTAKLFFVDGDFDEGVLLGVAELPGIQTLEMAREYRDRGFEYLGAQSSWLLVGLIYWIHHQQIAVEAEMVLMYTPDPATASLKVEFFEYDERFYDPLIDNLALSSDQLEDLDCLGISTIFPMGDSPTGVQPFFEQMVPWDDKMVESVLGIRDVRRLFLAVSGGPDTRASEVQSRSPFDDND